MSSQIYPPHITQLRMQLMSLARRLRREAQSDDQSWARLLLLGAIDRHGGAATPSRLAEAESMRSSNLAAALRDLEADGLILRTPDAEDRRKVRVQLSEAGRELLHANRARRERWLAEAVDACLTEEERARLIDAGALLERIAAYSEPDTTDE
jgi:DNA-binding MarR family transcriptional regulator